MRKDLPPPSLLNLFCFSAVHTLARGLPARDPARGSESSRAMVSVLVVVALLGAAFFSAVTYTAVQQAQPHVRGSPRTLPPLCSGSEEEEEEHATPNALERPPHRPNQPKHPSKMP